MPIPEEKFFVFDARYRTVRNVRPSTKHAEVMVELVDWFGPDPENTPCVVTPTRVSKTHKLVEAAYKGYAMLINDRANEYPQEQLDAMCEFLLSDSQVFLVSQNWHELMKQAEGYDGMDVMVPADICTFEMTIDGKHIIFKLACPKDEVPTLRNCAAFTAYELADGFWGVMAPYRLDNMLHSRSDYKLSNTIDENVLALCVGLEAEVLTQTLVRAPERLNKKRMKEDKPPLRDHYTVDLTKRHRTDPVEYPVHGERQSPRLHFRRGHWRHFENHKTWIKWMLVGNAELGTVTHQYHA